MCVNAHWEKSHGAGSAAAYATGGSVGGDERCGHRGRPAGLTAAYELVLRGVRRSCSIRTSVVGGLAQTAEYKGFRFDIGGHRFFTKVPRRRAAVARDARRRFPPRPRLSRIYYRGRFFDYPLKPLNALAQPRRSRRASAVVLSYLWARAPPDPPGGELRRLGDQPLRPAAVPHLLRELHREGVGHSVRRRSARSGPRSGSRVCRCATAVMNMLLPDARDSGAARSRP